ncbi:hypothetical protein EDC01DRAFT_628431 [Geopyxis carbonaria]|nr:hypothetical protein EDC01DRAFT_628431 [Geopyxis carbonaria]
MAFRLRCAGPVVRVAAAAGSATRGAPVRFRSRNLITTSQVLDPRSSNAVQTQPSYGLGAGITYPRQLERGYVIQGARKRRDAQPQKRLTGGSTGKRWSPSGAVSEYMYRRATMLT